MKADLIIKDQGLKAFEFVSKFIDTDTPETIIVKSSDKFNIEAIDGPVKSIVNLHKINDIRDIPEFLNTVNSKLLTGGIFIGCFESHQQRNIRLLKKFPFLFGHIYMFFDFIFKRVFPKISLTKWLYFFVTAGRNRVLPKAEALGSLAFCGYEILNVQEINNICYFACAKTEKPVPKENPSFGFLFKMKRIGKDNKLITVYKIRTMHPYAEYLQDYVYSLNNLQDGGKFKDDFRITSWGKILRKFWIDEIPMVYNLLKGEIKLVGVRPLSQHYLSLYNEELRMERGKVKPGLVPPFYADLPVTLQEIMDSELRYIYSYHKQSFKTDLNYLAKAMHNIVIKSVRTN